mgnify:CR=1 FL=1
MIDNKERKKKEEKEKFPISLTITIIFTNQSIFHIFYLEARCQQTYIK